MDRSGPRRLVRPLARTGDAPDRYGSRLDRLLRGERPLSHGDAPSGAGVGRHGRCQEGGATGLCLVRPLLGRGFLGPTAAQGSHPRLRDARGRRASRSGRCRRRRTGAGTSTRRQLGGGRAESRRRGRESPSGRRGARERANRPMVYRSSQHPRDRHRDRPQGIASDPESDGAPEVGGNGRLAERSRSERARRRGHLLR